MLRRFALVCSLAAALISATGASALARPYDYLLAPASKCGNETNPTLPPGQQERVMLCMHNYARARVGVAPLHASSLLQASAAGKTADLIRCGFSHTACGRSLFYWFTRVGYIPCGTWQVGENIAWWPESSANVRTIMSAWLNSDGHRHNLLSPSFRDAGFGLRMGKISGHSAAAWTAHFGYRSC